MRVVGSANLGENITVLVLEDATELKVFVTKSRASATEKQQISHKQWLRLTGELRSNGVVEDIYDAKGFRV